MKPLSAGRGRGCSASPARLLHAEAGKSAGCVPREGANALAATAGSGFSGAPGSDGFPLFYAHSWRWVFLCFPAV